jgi:hypothetical protein
MTEQIVTEWKFEYVSTNHSVFRGTVKAVSIKNRDEQTLSLLFQRYRRKIGLENVKFIELTDKW